MRKVLKCIGKAVVNKAKNTMFSPTKKNKKNILHLHLRISVQNTVSQNTWLFHQTAPQFRSSTNF